MPISTIVGSTDVELGRTQEEADRFLDMDRIVMITAEPTTHYEQCVKDMQTGEMHWFDSIKIPLITTESVEVVGVAMDITDRRRSQELIIQTNEQLIHANEELDRFVYSASHEMRTPLSSALGIIQFFENERDPKIILEYINMLSHLLNRMDKIIGSLANYSDNDKRDLSIEALDLGAIIIEAGDYVRRKYKLPKIQFDTCIEQNCAFYSDERRVVLIVQKLLSNAFQYIGRNNPMPRIALRVNITRAQAVIEVEDNGIGIEPQHQENIFKMFYRATTEAAGAGLGLYIARNIIDKLGGQIKVSSAPGKGSLFTVILPDLAAAANGTQA